MVKMQAAVGKEVIVSSINSPLCQKFSLKSKNNYKNNHKNSKKAFSVAEAMIALLIGSLALGMAAPMITKQVKFQNMTDTQNRVLAQRIQELEEELLPEGMIRFFYNRACPQGWTPITAADGSSLDGYYLRLSSSSDDNEIGTTLEPALPNIIAGFPGVGQPDANQPTSYWSEDENKDGVYGAIYIKNVDKKGNIINQPPQGAMVANNNSERDNYFGFDASNHNNIYGSVERALPQNPTAEQKKWAQTEVRPRSVVISACRRL